MKVETKAYGLIDIDEKQRLVFPQGLLGFEMYKDYALLDAEKQPFYWLQSLDAAPLAFILINPFLFMPDYEVDVSAEDLQFIGIDDPKKALVFSLVTVPASGGPMTANLQGPLLINRDTRRGVQSILTDPRWKTKHDVMAELSARNQRQAGERR
ncbi:MAG: flagellar assembly protein FliW [Treponematales bacterium]